MPLRSPRRCCACSQPQKQHRFFLPKLVRSWIGKGLQGYNVTRIWRIANPQPDRDQLKGGRSSCLGKRGACPTMLKRDGSLLMAARLVVFCALPFLILHSLSAQETPSPSPATVASPIASPSATATPSPVAPPLTDALFKNLKARSIGPAVMGGRVTDIAIDPRNPFIFYVGLGRRRVSIDRCRRNMAERRFERKPHHCAHRCRSEEARGRLRRSDGESVGRGWRARVI